VSAVPATHDANFADARPHLVRDAALASLTGALSGGVVLVAFALSLGAGPFTIGLLSAIPLVAQLAQLPGIVLIERLRRRKALALPVITAARFTILLLALLPFVTDMSMALSLLVAAQATIALLGSLGACAVNSWLHQLVPAEARGPFFARRLLWGTLVAAVGALLAGQAIDRTPGHARDLAFAGCFALAGLAGFASAWQLSRAPEPPMSPRASHEPLHLMLRRPLADTNFRRLLLFIGSWAAVSNIAAPRHRHGRRRRPRPLLAGTAGAWFGPRELSGVLRWQAPRAAPKSSSSRSRSGSSCSSPRPWPACTCCTACHWCTRKGVSATSRWRSCSR
jgi:MFS family permease